MVVLKIFDVDSQNNETPLTILQVGEHILGRESFSNCTDRKISRKHAVINVEENQATLTSVHVNPCFYISQSSPRVQILTKDIPVNLVDGDKFAFSSNYWYIIKIIRDELETPTLNNSSITVPISNRESSCTVVASSSSVQNTETASPLKRSLEELNSDGRKKLKTINQSLDQLLQNIRKIESQDFPNGSSLQQNKSNETDDTAANKTVEVFRKKDATDSDDEDSDIEMTPEVTRDTEVVTNVELHHSESDEKEEQNSNLDGNHSDKDEVGESDPMTDVQKEPMEASSDKLNGNEKTVRKEEVSDSDKDEGEEKPKLHPPDANNLNDVSINGSTYKKEKGDASASTSGESMANKLRREQCWYGGSCYRKNSSHRDEFSHPGDSDYDRDQNDDQPECPYGAQCYRSNQRHRRQYKHPSSDPAPKPATTGKKRRAAAAASRISIDDSDSEDDEPFSADDSSSDNYDQDESDSDISDSQNFDDAENSEEVRIMFKEAKKFLKKQHKD